MPTEPYDTAAAQAIIDEATEKLSHTTITINEINLANSGAIILVNQSERALMDTHRSACLAEYLGHVLAPTGYSAALREIKRLQKCEATMIFPEAYTAVWKAFEAQCAEAERLRGVVQSHLVSDADAEDVRSGNDNYYCTDLDCEAVVDANGKGPHTSKCISMTPKGDEL